MGYKVFFRNCANYLTVALAKTSKHCRDGNRQSPDPLLTLMMTEPDIEPEIDGDPDEYENI